MFQSRDLVRSGGQLGDGDHRYSLQMTIEYVIHREVREIRVPVLVWYA